MATAVVPLPWPQAQPVMLLTTFLAFSFRSIFWVRGLAHGIVQLSAPSAAVIGVVPAVGGAALAEFEPGLGEAGADWVAGLEGAGLAGAGVVGWDSDELEQLLRAATVAIETATGTSDLTNLRDWKGIRAL